MKIIQKKRKTGETDVPGAEAEPDPAPDLMAALKESLARGKRT
jgi:non-homologous end joining protein Ku